jgi:sec-independent protein translocase protein TatB
MEILVIALVGLVVLGPDKLPELAREAGRVLRTLREMASGARTQLREELGPEFADIDLRNLNPRTAVRRAVLGDDDELASLDPRTFLRDSIMGTDADREEPAGSVSLAKEAPGQRPLGRGEQAPFDPDATRSRGSSPAVVPLCTFQARYRGRFTCPKGAKRGWAGVRGAGPGGQRAAGVRPSERPTRLC